MDILIMKIGGSIQDQLPASFYQIIAQLQQTKKCYPVIVHGGGPMINQLLEKLAIPTRFVNGLRVTTQEVLTVVKMVLSGSINNEIVTQCQIQHLQAIGISGIDHGLLKVRPIQATEDIGFVGEVTEVNTAFLMNLLENNIIPVISPIGMDEKGQHYNINGDMAASAVAKALGGKLAFISDVPGVMEREQGILKVHPSLTKQEAEKLIEEAVITDGMIPKVRSALGSLSNQMNQAVILNGLKPEDIASYLKGNEVGTKFVYKEEVMYG